MSLFRYQQRQRRGGGIKVGNMKEIRNANNDVKASSFN
jgi:hypothetical protein